MSKSREKRARNPNNLANKSIFYAILTGLNGVLTSVFVKIIQRNVTGRDSYSN
jgi:hypothetical protein